MSTNDPYQSNEGIDINDVRMHQLGRLPHGGWPQHYTQPPSTNNLAVASLVLGILWVFWIGSVLAVIFGHTALKEIKRRGQSGQGLAVAGLVLGYVGVGTFVLFVLLPLLAAAGA